MKKLLSVILALTILIVPVGANTCMAAGREDNAILKTLANNVQNKKSSHKLLFLEVLGAVLSVSAYSMNKFCADGECGEKAGKYAGKYVVKARDLVNLNWEKLNEFIKNNPTLDKIVTDCANYLSTTKENFLKNLKAFTSELSKTEETVTLKNEVGMRPWEQALKSVFSD